MAKKVQVRRVYDTPYAAMVLGYWSTGYGHAG